MKPRGVRDVGEMPHPLGHFWDRPPQPCPPLQSAREKGPGHPAGHQGPGLGLAQSRTQRTTVSHQGGVGRTERWAGFCWTVSRVLVRLLLGGMTLFSFF